MGSFVAASGEKRWPPAGSFVAPRRRDLRREHSDERILATAAVSSRRTGSASARDGADGVMRLGQAEPPLGQTLDIGIQCLADPRGHLIARSSNRDDPGYVR